MKPIPRSALLLLCACAAGAAADDPSTPKLEKPKPAPTSWAALTSKISAAPLLSVRGAPIGMVRYAAKGYEVVRPYMVNPLSLPREKGLFLALFLVAVLKLLSSLTSVLMFFTDPVRFTSSLCFGTVLFKASFVALYGPQAQLGKWTRVDRLPYTMLYSFSLAAALYNGVFAPNRLAARLFGAMHLAAFLLDVCSHIKGGKHIVKWVLARYLALLRFVAGLAGIEFKTPIWMAK